MERIHKTCCSCLLSRVWFSYNRTISMMLTYQEHMCLWLYICIHLETILPKITACISKVMAWISFYLYLDRKILSWYKNSCELLTAREITLLWYSWGSWCVKYTTKGDCSLILQIYHNIWLPYFLILKYNYQQLYDKILK